MTDPTPNDPPNPPQDREIALHPAEALTHLIVTLLAPMFLMASGGDLLFARMAALETVNAYRARDHVDLIAIAQLVGCALAALGSIGLSMADDLSLSMTLRLRGNATAMNRSVEHARRALKEPRPAAATQTKSTPRTKPPSSPNWPRPKRWSRKPQPASTPPNRSPNPPRRPNASTTR